MAYLADAPCLTASTPGSGAAVSAASFVAAAPAFAAFAASVAGAAALPVVFWLQWRAAAPVAGAAAPASAEACPVPAAVLRIAFPVAADISGRASRCPYLAQGAASSAEGREDGRACSVERRYSPDGSPDDSPGWEPTDCPAHSFRRDWRAGCMRLPPPGPSRRGP